MTTGTPRAPGTTGTPRAAGTTGTPRAPGTTGTPRAPGIPGAEEIIARYPRARSALMPLLHAVAERDGHVTEGGMIEVADHLGLSAAEVLGVCSFYSMYKREPCGRLLVSVCTSVSCLVNGGPDLLDHLRQRYADDPEVTVEEVECLAASDGAPVMQVNYEFHERMTPAEAERIVEAYKAGELTPRGPSGEARFPPAGGGGR